MPHQLDLRIVEEEETAFGAGSGFHQTVAQVVVELGAQSPVTARRSPVI